MAVDPTITALDPWLHSPPRVVECLIQPGGTATVALRAGDELNVVDVHGQQVVDFWAYTPDWLERSSMENTRVHSRSMRPTAGDTFYSSIQQPTFTMTEDTSGEHHDTLLAACAPQRYTLLGHEGNHANCSDNHRAALEIAGPRSTGPAFAQSLRTRRRRHDERACEHRPSHGRGALVLHACFAPTRRSFTYCPCAHKTSCQPTVRR